LQSAPADVGAAFFGAPDWWASLDGFRAVEALVPDVVPGDDICGRGPPGEPVVVSREAICDRFVDLRWPRLTCAKSPRWPLTNLVPTWPRYVSCRRHGPQARDLRHARQDAGVVERFAITSRNTTPRLRRSNRVQHRHVARFHQGVDEHLPDARVTFDKFPCDCARVQSPDGVRGEQKKTDPALKGMRWSLLKDADKLNLDN